MGLIVTLLGFIATVSALPQAREFTYEYIVVGSGAGGGPLASRLARAGHSVLLIESGDDQGSNSNYTVPGFQGNVAHDPQIRWDVYVNHYQDQTRAKRDPKYVYDLPDGNQYVGLNPPSGAVGKGILYPRAGTLGGCVSHNALVWVTPHASDWNYISSITGDGSWAAPNMARYLDKVYEWLNVETTSPTALLHDSQMAQQVASAASIMGILIPPVSTITGLLNALTASPTNPFPGRDSTQGLYQIPLITRNGQRNGVRERIVDTVNQGYPLTVRSNCHVTKIFFDTTSGPQPRATGVEFLDGAHLYRPSPLSGSPGNPGCATATKEVIMAGGTYNTVQLLKLSGLGPGAELSALSIPVLKALPGLGTNMQDRYEVPVNVRHTQPFSILTNCTFDASPQDDCYQIWRNNPNNAVARSPYTSNSLATAMAVHSTTAVDSNIDLFLLGGPVNFRGYYPDWGAEAVADHRYWSWYALKAHSSNTAGTVTLRSTDPLEQPEINFNYFDTGTTANGADVADLRSMVQAINISRQALGQYASYGFLNGSSFVEMNPGPEVQTDAQLETYVKDTAWGHHACCTAKIGNDSDSMAVLDAKFRARGVDGLRVVDASVFPKIPGIFLQAPIFMVAEKAADVILNG